MSTDKNQAAKNVKTMTMEEMSIMLSDIKNGQVEVQSMIEKQALSLGALDQRVTRAEGSKVKVDAEEVLEAAVDAAAAAKPGMLGKFRQASTGKKVLVATATTAAVAGVAYAGYKGYEVYQDRKEANLLTADITTVEALPSVSPTKSDAIRQSLGK